MKATGLLALCYRIAAQQWLAPMVLFAAALLSLSGLLWLLTSEARTEWVMLPCLILLWILLLGLIRQCFYPVPAPFTSQGWRLKLQQWWRSCWQFCLLSLIVVISLASLVLTFKLSTIMLRLL